MASVPEGLSAASPSSPSSPPRSSRRLGADAFSDVTRHELVVHRAPPALDAVAATDAAMSALERAAGETEARVADESLRSRGEPAGTSRAGAQGLPATTGEHANRGDGLRSPRVAEVVRALRDASQRAHRSPAGMARREAADAHLDARAEATEPPEQSGDPRPSLAQIAVSTFVLGVIGVAYLLSSR